MSRAAHDVAARAVDGDRVRISVYGVAHDLDVDTAHALMDELRDALRESARMPF